MTEQLVCWRCGTPLDEMVLPVSRYAECNRCHADLHVCRMCEFFDLAVADDCREPVAERVDDKDRANFCGYFAPMPRAWRPENDAERRQALAELEALFGGASPVSGDGSAGGGKSEAERAREALEQLFRSD